MKLVFIECSQIYKINDGNKDARINGRMYFSDISELLRNYCNFESEIKFEDNNFIGLEGNIVIGEFSSGDDLKEKFAEYLI